MRLVGANTEGSFFLHLHQVAALTDCKLVVGIEKATAPATYATVSNEKYKFPGKVFFKVAIIFKVCFYVLILL